MIMLLQIDDSGDGDGDGNGNGTNCIYVGKRCVASEMQTSFPYGGGTDLTAYLPSFTLPPSFFTQH